MPPKVDFSQLKSSWTKYDAVQVIEIISANELPGYLSGNKKIDKPVIRAILGIATNESSLPYYWEKIYLYPKQLRLFALIASLTTHHSNIKKFSEKYSQKGQLGGLFKVEPNDKQATNIRSALIISGAALENYRKQPEVPFSFSALFENGEVGLLTKDLFKARLERIGYTDEFLNSDSNFIKLCHRHDFVGMLGMHKTQFERWIKGESIDSQKETFRFSQLEIYKEISMIRVNQWMNEWDDIDFKSPLRSKPKPVFYMFSIDARLLKRIADVHRRKADGGRQKDIHVQRKRNDQRIEEIRKYIEGGFPWSTISKQEQRMQEYEDLKMPGLLPTAIIANVIGKNEKRDGNIINPKDLISIEDVAGKPPKLRIPDHIFQNESWNPDLKPIEIIDGQHRLWAFDENQNLSGNYELPVIIFDNLDRTWQAYLFYSINIKPVKINTSLGFDLYPLLRTQNWLEKSKDGLLAYRETRAQEIVEALWNFPSSSWYQRINMIGESTGIVMSQAAFIRSLVNSFFKRSKGLYGDVVDENNYKVLNWNRAQQASFIILLWNSIAEAVKLCDAPWAVFLREEIESAQNFNNVLNLDLAYTSKNSFLTRDQGVRGILSFANDFFYIAANNNDIDFNSFVWLEELDDSTIENASIEEAIAIFSSNEAFISLVKLFAITICQIDWRTSTAKFALPTESETQMRYRGSGGYSEFWKELLKAFKKSENPLIIKYVNQMNA